MNDIFATPCGCAWRAVDEMAPPIGARFAFTCAMAHAARVLREDPAGLSPRPPPEAERLARHVGERVRVVHGSDRRELIGILVEVSASRILISRTGRSRNHAIAWSELVLVDLDPREDADR